MKFPSPLPLRLILFLENLAAERAEGKEKVNENNNNL